MTPRLSAKETSPVGTTPALSHVFGCGKGLWIPATMERLFSSSWVALTKPSVILAGAGIQSPLSQKTWSGYAGRLASQPRTSGDHSCIVPHIWMWERALDSRYYGKAIFILMSGFNQAIRHSRRSGNPEPFISKDLVGIRRTPRLSAKETSPVGTTPALSHVFGCGKGLWIPAAARKTGVVFQDHV